MPNQNADLKRAEGFLRDFIGKALASVECDEFHLELLFHDGSRFRTQCSWRVIQGDSLLFGRGDIGGQISSDAYAGIIGLKVASASISTCWDTDLRFENDYVVQTLSDTVQFETWVVNLDAGWVILSDGRITVFPPAPAAPITTPSP
jgi:hypothetical protein